jgi:hypothetical protein
MVLAKTDFSNITSSPLFLAVSTFNSYDGSDNYKNYDIVDGGNATRVSDYFYLSNVQLDNPNHNATVLQDCLNASICTRSAYKGTTYPSFGNRVSGGSNNDFNNYTLLVKDCEYYSAPLGGGNNDANSDLIGTTKIIKGLVYLKYIDLYIGKPQDAIM